ncbi:MAG: FAD:protein FMN transferase [Kistimonas sp.]|nr:FAD:protein FMN transferase [Kistimonas sp.]
MRRERLVLPLLLAAVFVAALYWYSRQQPHLEQLHGATMGTSWSVKYVSVPYGVSRPVVVKAVKAALEDVNQAMSTWRPDSELMQLNRAPVGEVVQVSQPLFDLVAQASALSRLSAGAYDVTAGALVNLWGFGSERPQGREEGPAAPGAVSARRPESLSSSHLAAWLAQAGQKQAPAPEQIAEALRQVGYQTLRLDETHRTITKTRAVFIDLSSIAKGYGVDRVAAALQEQGLENYMVEVGGEVFLRGDRPDGEPWRIAVRQPVVENRVQLIVAPGDRAIATSGDYLNYYELQDVHFSHLIDARTGYPEQHRLASVTVVADTAAEADGWATLLMIVGEQAGRELAEQHGLDAFFIYHKESGFAVLSTGRFDSWRLDGGS